MIYLIFYIVMITPSKVKKKHQNYPTLYYNVHILHYALLTLFRNPQLF